MFEMDYKGFARYEAFPREFAMAMVPVAKECGGKIGCTKVGCCRGGCRKFGCCKGGAEEPVEPHPLMDQLPGIQYCVNSPPPWPEALLLGFQHYVLSLGMIVLIPSVTVPQMGGGNIEKAKVIQTLLFVSGMSTLMQSLFGTRLPSVIGASYSYLIPLATFLQAKKYTQFSEPLERFEHTMRGIQGALIITSCFQIIVGFFGLWRALLRFISPLSMVPLVTFTGLGLYQYGFSMLATCIEVGLPELILMVFISQYLPQFIKTKRPIFDRYSVLFSVAIVWVYAQILTASGAYHKSPDRSRCRTDHAGLIGGAPWVYMPLPFQWGTPTFNAGEIFAMMAASFVSTIESTGTFLATARYGRATPVPPSVISRGIGWLGVGTFMDGLFGGVAGSSASVENAGLLALTKVGSRRVIQISAGFMIFFSILGKFGALFASIPLPALAALYCIFFAYVASAGLGFLQFCNLNSLRTKFILGFSLFLGISIPQYFKEYQLSSGVAAAHTPSRWFNDMMSTIFMSNATVAAIVSLILDCTLSRGDAETQKDTGCHWLEQFAAYDKDVRSDEFYALPCNLNVLFPPL